jgi:hypothetical protein
MSGQDILRDKARELIRTGMFPSRRPDRVWGGAGFAGYPCVLCGVAIKHEEMAVELEFAVDAEPGVINPNLHVNCFLAVELELLQVEARAAEAATLRIDRPQSAPTQVSSAHPQELPLS